MTAGLRAATASPTAEGRNHLELKHLYLDELRRVLAAEKPRAWPRGIQWIIDYTEARPVAVHRPGEHRTWVWSDLHLRHANIIKHCGRPFTDARDMDRALMTAWKSAVGPNDTALNGSDVALAASLRKRGPARIRATPGRKLLAVGNHDFGTRTGVLEPAGQDLASGILAVDSDPPLVLTHVPIGVVPPG